MNTMFLVFAAVVILLLIILIFVILKLTQKPQKKNKSASGNKSVKLRDLVLPSRIEGLAGHDLKNASKSVLDSFKALDYKNKSPEASSKNEWHSWQVSLILCFLKKSMNFNPVNPKDIFDETTLSMSKKELDEALHLIYQKYNGIVNIEKDRDSLSKENIWTAREVSIILFAILMQKYM